jgi:hypothetical protein
MAVCRVCGKIDCEEHSFKFEKTKNITQFSGSSPPEIFVGKYNYPNVYVGILSPKRYGNTEIHSSQELWHKHKLPMEDIKHLRSQLIYGRTKSNIKKVLEQNRFISTMQEIAMTSSSISAEFKLLKNIEQNQEKESHVPIISNAAFVKSVRLQENPRIKPKIDHLVNDTDINSATALQELEKNNIPTNTIIKILSAGLLGKANTRKLVPTRWAITAVDDTLSKQKLQKVRSYSQIGEILLFTSEYLGNHYEFLLLPDIFSFEVIEINSSNLGCWQDYESNLGRKSYASNVTGAYYANRLALLEYLEKQQKQASCIVFREIGKEYTQSMGVGVLREISRAAFLNKPEKFSSINEALERIQTRIKLQIVDFTEKSILLKDYGKQKKLDTWFGK